MTESQSLKRLTKKHLAAIDELHTKVLCYGPCEVALGPLQVEALCHPGLAEKLIAQIEAEKLAVNLQYWIWLKGEPPDLTWARKGCGTTACLAGHVVLAHKAKLPTAPLPWMRVASSVLWGGQEWGVETLALLIWQATYPAGNLELFADGIDDPTYIPGRYGQSPDSLEASALVAFLKEASGAA